MSVPPSASVSGVSPEVRAECEDLLYLEAELLDARRYGDWLELFADDATYWAPLREGQEDPNAELNLIYDDRARMSDRVYRLESGAAFAQDPPSRTARTVSNVRTIRDLETGHLLVTSAFMLFEFRLGRQQILGGRYTHALMPSDEGLLILSKKIDLANSEGSFENLTFLL